MENSSELDFSSFEQRLECLREREGARHLSQQRSKLKFWLKDKKLGQPMEKKGEGVPYLNLSNVKLNEYQDFLLKRGPKYIINDSINLKDSIPKIETAIETLPVDSRDEIRMCIQNEICKRIKNSKKDSEDRKTLQELKNNKNLTIAHTDKTGKIVIMDKCDYNKQMEEAIIKLSVKEIETDPNKKITTKVKNLIKEGKWPNNKPVIKNFAPNTPRAFGRLKDHKDPVRMRPIVNKMEGPTYPIEKYMKDIYQEILPESTVALNSTFEFIQKIREIKIQPEDHLVSFDVKDLYPSINTEEIKPVINNILTKNFEQDIANTLISASNLIINHSYFTFNRKFYQQVKGVPMGSPISGVLAEFKLRTIENSFLEVNKDTIKFWCRYVDDIFTIIKAGTRPEDILEDLNQLDENIKFTMEIEVDNKLSFLDTIVMKQNNQILTTVFRKPTASNEIISAKCKTPNAYKKSAIYSYVNRALTVCSNESLLKDELNFITNIASKAGYTKKTIDKIIKERKQKLDQINPAQKQKKKFTTPINYDQGVAIILQKKAAKHNIFVPIKPSKNIFQRIRNEKDKIEDIKTAGIYRIPFKTEDQKTGAYIGMTKRKIEERIKEHKKDIEFNRCTTALSQKNNTDNITIEFENTTKIANYINKGYAIKRESIEIILDPAATNIMEHSQLNSRWKTILKSAHARKIGRKTEKDENDSRCPEEGQTRPKVLGT